MTDRREWKCALSVGWGAMNEKSFCDLRENGICELELSSGDLAPFYDKLDFVHRAGEITKTAKSCGVNISSVHLPFAPFGEIDPASLDPAKRDYAVRVQSELLHAAGEGGIGIAVIHPSGEPYREDERAERMKAAVETIAKIEEAAYESGVTLALENLPRTCLCRTHDEMAQFLDSIPRLRVCFDMNHSLTEQNEDYIAAAADKIVTLHVSDYDRVDERHWLPGKGVNDWEKLISLLEEKNYCGRWLYELRGGEAEYSEVYENYRELLLK